MRSLALAALALLPGARPDVLLPGTRPVEHVLVLDWAEVPDGTRFVASPMRGFHGHHVIRRGEPFAFSGKYGTRILVAPPGAVLPAPERAVRGEGWPSAAVPVAEVASAALASPLQRVVTTLRVARVDERELELAVTGEQRFGPAGLPLDGPLWLPIAAIGLAGAVWLLCFRRTTGGEARA